jgi:hypothetical protein
MKNTDFEVGYWYEVLYVLGTQKLKIFAYLFKTTERNLVFDLSKDKKKAGNPPNLFIVKIESVVSYWKEGDPIKDFPTNWI